MVIDSSGMYDKTLPAILPFSGSPPTTILPTVPRGSPQLFPMTQAIKPSATAYFRRFMMTCFFTGHPHARFRTSDCCLGNPSLLLCSPLGLCSLILLAKGEAVYGDFAVGKHGCN